MCIICLKPAGTSALMNLDRLRNCWDNNSDGAGVMYPHEGQVRLSKGFMTWTAFEQYVRLMDDVLTPADVGFHFRIATHGTVDAANTHPFPLTKHEHKLRRPDGYAEIAMMHNGVLGGLIERNGTCSDTMVFARDFLSQLGVRTMTPEIMSLINALGDGNKFLFMTHRQLYWSGDSVELSGWRYSNRSYVKRMPAPPTYPTCGTNTTTKALPGARTSTYYGGPRPFADEKCVMCNADVWMMDRYMCNGCDPDGYFEGWSPTEIAAAHSYEYEIGEH